MQGSAGRSGEFFKSGTRRSEDTQKAVLPGQFLLPLPLHLMAAMALFLPRLALIR